MSLTDTAIRNAKLGPAPYKLYDGAGLFLLLKPNGSRLWRLKYHVSGREKLIGLGHYPEVSLKAARERRDEARRLLAAEIDPAEKRKAEKQALPDTFEAIAREFLALRAKSLNPRTCDLKAARLGSFVFPPTRQAADHESHRGAAIDCLAGNRAARPS
jgi:hypothetical protein